MSSNAVRRYDHLIATALDEPWAITPTMMAIIAEVLCRHVAGEDPDDEAIHHAQLLALARQERQVAAPEGSGVAVLPMHGVITPRMNLMSDVSGGTTFESLTNDLVTAADNPRVKAIVLDIDSPGGSVAGATEFASVVRKVRTQKPVVAQASHGMNSAAYWTGSNATEIVASPSASVGGIGVFAAHDDLSKAYEKRGLKRNFVSAGKYKLEGNDTAALDDEARSAMQAKVDHHYGVFVHDVALGRGIDAAKVRAGFGEGRSLTAPEALAAGMVDRIATLSETVARLAGNPTPTFSTHAAHRDTSQEPSEATDQDRAAAAMRQWRSAHERAFLEQALTRSC
jgi:signal peptide peptidase SppA